MADMSKYQKAPWHSTKDELPNTSRGNRCVCYIPSLGIEMAMIFHRSRKDSGYKDFFTGEGRSYDYDFISYWRYSSDKEESVPHEIQKHDVVRLHGIGGPLEGKYGEVTEVFPNGTYHVKAGIIEIDQYGYNKTTVYTIAVSGSCMEYDDFKTRTLRRRGSYD